MMTSYVIIASQRDLMRTIVELPEEQIAALKQLSDKTKLSRAELMRRAVADYILKHHKNTKYEAFGLWSENPVDALTLQILNRDEWNDERSL